ncbi:MAG TPA: hypothetical protein VMV46_09780 [Thermoanaerobaculia bacterium]|nr:hypothetical protein [Thermoanaerobaculia bacterium]
MRQRTARPGRRRTFRVMLACSTIAVTACLVAAPAAAQSSSCDCRGIDDFGFRKHFHDQPARLASGEVGQDALGAIQEVVGLLLADPATDWSAVSIARLRQHLVDLDRLTLVARVEETEIERGLRVRVAGDDEVLAAARRAVLRHATRMDGFRGWRVTGEDTGDAVVLELSTEQEAEVAVLRGLGFYGFLASGVHRPHQLLAIARGVGE